MTTATQTTTGRLIMKFEVLTVYAGQMTPILTRKSILEAASYIGNLSTQYGKPVANDVEGSAMFTFPNGDAVGVKGLRVGQLRGAWKQGRCGRCDGSGEFEAFRHVQAGICFRCIGTGVEPVKGTEGSAGMLQAGQEVVRTRKLLEALDADKGNDTVVPQPVNVDPDVPVNPLRDADVQVVVPTVEEVVATPTEVVVPEGTFTFETAGSTSGDHFTFRIKTVKKGNLKGKKIVEYLSGPDNTNDFQGFAFVDADGTVKTWGRFNGGHLRDVIAPRITTMIQSGNMDEAGMSYALRSGRCRRCNRELTVPASIHRGYGPECATKV